VSDPRRLLGAGALAALAVVVAVGPPRPRQVQRGRPRLVAVPDIADDLEPFDASDVLAAHAVTVT
jgi:hypothetical protein